MTFQAQRRTEPERAGASVAFAACKTARLAATPVQKLGLQALAGNPGLARLANFRNGESPDLGLSSRCHRGTGKRGASAQSPDLGSPSGRAERGGRSPSRSVRPPPQGPARHLRPEAVSAPTPLRTASRDPGGTQARGGGGRQGPHGIIFDASASGLQLPAES